MKTLYSVLACLLWSTLCPAAMAPYQAIMAKRQQLFRGRTLMTPEPVTNVWASIDFSDHDTWALTHTDEGVSELERVDGVLRFRLAADTAVLGWGNFADVAAVPPPPLAWSDGAYVVLRIRQEHPGKEDWRLQFRYQGDPRDTGICVWYLRPGRKDGFVTVPGTQEGTDWKEAEVRIQHVAEADGMGLFITGEKGSLVEIDRVAVVRRSHAVWARKTFVLPDACFSAVATIPTGQDVWVNGHLAMRREIVINGGWYQYTSVDLAPFLKPGKNVVAVHDPMDMPKTPTCWLMCDVNTDSGTSVRIDTDKTWKVENAEEDGWTATDFDDRHWRTTSNIDPTGYRNRHSLGPLLVHAARGRVPAYSGQIQLSNPYGEKLYYRESQPVRCVLELPPKLPDGDRVVTYRMYDERTGGLVGDGHAEFVQATAASRRYRMDAGLLPAGVYSLWLDAAHGTNPSLARQELLIVTRRLPMPDTDGDTWDADCKLTLVDDIDCTDPDDPHEFQDAGRLNPEHASTIVERNGLTYRETPLANDFLSKYSWFAYRFRFKHLNRPHWIVVEYPDDAIRHIECQLQPFFTLKPGMEASTTAQAGFGMVTGGKNPLTHRMQKARALVWSQQEDNILLFSKACRSQGKLAASRIRIYEIDELPALKTATNGRRFGLLTERASVPEATYGPSNIFIRNKWKRKGGVFPGSVPEAYAHNPYLQWFDAAENYARYCRFTGQNAYFQGSFQYLRQSGWVFDSGAEGCSLIPDVREVMINVLEANGISTYATVEYCGDFTHWTKGWPALHQALEGADFMFQVDNEGYSLMGSYQADNPMTSPLARTTFLDALAERAARYGRYSGFKGIFLLFAPNWEDPTYLNRRTSVDDATCRLFMQETGIRIPVTDTSMARFGKRYAWLMQNAEQAWFDWRSQKMREVHEAAGQRLRQVREDLDYFVIIEPYSRPGDPEGLTYRYRKGGSLRRILRTHGYDPLEFQGTHGFSFGRAMWSYDSPGNRRGDVARWEFPRDPEAIDLFNRGCGAYRTSLVRTGFNEYYILPLRHVQQGLWTFPHMIGYAWPAHAYAAQRLTTQVADSDVQVLAYGFSDCFAPVGAEQPIRRFARAFTSLPATHFDTLSGKGRNSNICIRHGRSGEDAFLYVANPAWWSCEVEIAGLTSPDTDLVLARTGETADVKQGVLHVSLAPYGLEVFRRRAPNIGPGSVQVRIPDPARDYLSRLCKLVGQKYRDKETSAAAASALEQGDLLHAWRIMTRWPLMKVLQTHLASEAYALSPDATVASP